MNRDDWTMILSPRPGLFELHLGELWRYRDLLWLFVRRDLVTVYKQTVLGPLWYVVQALFTTATFMFVFGGIAKLSTDGLPPILFYLAGVTSWGYFSQCLTATSATFVANAWLFGKVYFPRLITPLSIVISNLVKLAIQYFLFISIIAYYVWQGANVHPRPWEALLWSPLLVMVMAGFGLGLGLIVSSVTTKYRDLSLLVGFGVQLAMYATPVVYPLSALPPTYAQLVRWNPLTGVFEAFRYLYLGQGSFDLGALAYGTVVTAVTLLCGILLFNRVEKSFMDTV